MEAVIYTHLYRSYWKPLCQKLIASFGAGPLDAEDIAQQAFIKYGQHQSKTPIKNPQGYLFTLAKNLYIDQLRSQARYDKLIDNVFAELELGPIEVDSSEDIALQGEILSLIDQTLKSLPDKHQAILKANRIHGETYQQISDRTDYSVSDIFRILEIVNKVLQAAFDDWENGREPAIASGKRQ